MTRDELNQHARRAIRSGKMPCKSSPRVFGGRGNGESCTVCDSPITAAGLDLEFEPEGLTRQVHLDCFAAWQAECQNPEFEGGTQALALEIS